MSENGIAPAPRFPDGPIDAEPTTTAVIVVDVQRLFTDLRRFPPVDPPLDQVLPNMTRFLSEARAVGATIVNIRTIIGPGNSHRNTLGWPEFMTAQMAPGAPGTEFDPAVTPHPGDIEVVKRAYSSFMGTSLDSILRQRGIDTAIVFGLMTNVCVQSTVRDAWQLDYETITLSDCCSEGLGEHEMSLKTTARNFGRVCTSHEIVSHWQALHSGPPLKIVT